ncbi:MAG: hypothetical protein LQ351_000245 [Letrouitia transgressa]|nr:MAG: hypothetical protein LQ351_000245 [Letrouitia transgressa]
MATPSSNGFPQYNENVDAIRSTEYPMLQGKPLRDNDSTSKVTEADAIYLDHAGTTPIAQSLIQQFSRDMTTSLLGNPHSNSESSRLSTRRIEDVRLRALRFFNADPDDFDLVFVANATAGMKLVLEGFRIKSEGFWYGYHKDAHTSLVGLREDAPWHHCFESDGEVDGWLHSGEILPSDGSGSEFGLFGYPAQSNMNGRRLPLSWAERIRSCKCDDHNELYSLLDAAALVSTSPLDLSDSSRAPDYTVLSFYKIFGFPDLGALIIRKDASSPLLRRRYFGGGTVEMVTCTMEQWHIRKQETLHDQLEDGTLPIHSIIALDSALDVHARLFESMEKVASHTSFLFDKLYNELSSLRHGNGSPVCEMYSGPLIDHEGAQNQGPVIAFNLKDSRGDWVSNAEVEKLANVKSIHLRSGALCNPGGTASSLHLTPWEMKQNFSAGQRCGAENDVMGGKPTGVIRISLGAMSNLQDINSFVNFVKEFFVSDQRAPPVAPLPALPDSNFYVETLSIYPIKSCGGWQIPPGTSWAVKPEGLAWDREWCVVYQGSRTALSQKHYRKMALIRPSIDLEKGLLHVRFHGLHLAPEPNEITVPLSPDPSLFQCDGASTPQRITRVCGDRISTQVYASPSIAAFFTHALRTPCTLARFPAAPAGLSTRHTKDHLQRALQQRRQKDAIIMSGASPPPLPPLAPLLLSNESPILTISRSSLNRLNEAIKSRSGKAAHASVFRANVVLAQESTSRGSTEQAFAEDGWSGLCVVHLPDDGPGREERVEMDVLGPCRRCQMVCVDQTTGEKNEEPFVTLAKTRKGEGGKVFFGVHTALGGRNGQARIQVGDRVVPM